MKKTIFAILALLTITMSTRAYDLTVGTSTNGTITFKVDGATVATANEGATVTICIAPQGGYITTEVSANAYTNWGHSRAQLIDMKEDLALNRVDANTYTFPMPRANVRVNADYAINIDAEAEETQNESIDVAGIKFNMVVVDGEAPTYDTMTGLTTIPVAIESIDVPAQPDATTGNPKEMTIIVPATVKIGDNVFVVKEIKADAFKSKEPTVIVTKVVLPETEIPLVIAEGAMNPDGNPISVMTPLALLDDYALMASLKDNFEARKVSADVTAPNKYWTFSSGVDCILPEGITVYKVYLDDTTPRIIALTDVELVLGNGIVGIKANNGVLIACDNDKGGNVYNIIANPGRQQSGTKPAITNAKNYEGNKMEPVIEAANYPATNYAVLKNNNFHSIKENGQKVKACKAVLKIK